MRSTVRKAVPFIPVIPALLPMVLATALTVAALSLNLVFHRVSGLDFDPPAESVQRWNPRLFEILSFGHLPVAVDSLWIRALQDPSISHVKPGTHPPGYFDLDLATDLDRGFFEAYVTGASVLSVIRNDGPGARELLLKGDRFRKDELPGHGRDFARRFWPTAWQVPMLLGYVCLFDLNDMRDAASHFRDAGAIADAPYYLHQIADRLSHPGGEYEVGMRLLNFMRTQAKSRQEAAAIDSKRRSLFLAQFLFHQNEDFREFLDKIPEYRAAPGLSRARLEKFWERFVRTPGRRGAGATDPFGGSLSLGANGKIVSSTPHERIFGLD